PRRQRRPAVRPPGTGAATASSWDVLSQGCAHRPAAAPPCQGAPGANCESGPTQRDRQNAPGLSVGAAENALCLRKSPPPARSPAMNELSNTAPTLDQGPLRDRTFATEPVVPPTRTLVPPDESRTAPLAASPDSPDVAAFLGRYELQGEL